MTIQLGAPISLKTLKSDISGLSRYYSQRHKLAGQFEKLVSLRSAYHGREILIVANGPSSAEFSRRHARSFLRNGGMLMVMNWAHLNPLVSSLTPDFYVSADRRTLSDSKAKPLHQYLRASENLKLFVPEIREIEFKDLFPGHEVVSFCRIAVRLLRPFWWGNHPIFPKSFLSLTGLHAIQLAVWMGFSSIYIIGFDNNYFQKVQVDANNLLSLTATHAGEADRREEGAGSSMSTFLEQQATLFRDFEKFSEAPVLNLDAQSLTDAFSKIPCSQLSKGIPTPRGIQSIQGQSL